MDKLAALAKAFGVTADELLSPAEPGEGAPPPEPPRRQYGGFGSLSWLIRRYGWLAGVYIALSGGGIALVGGLARYSFLSMTRNLLGDGFFDSPAWTGGASAARAPLTIAAAILAVGLLTLAAGVILAIVLWRKGRKGD